MAKSKIGKRAVALDGHMTSAGIDGPFRLTPKGIAKEQAKRLSTPAEGDQLMENVVPDGGAVKMKPATSAARAGP